MFLLQRNDRASLKNSSFDSIGPLLTCRAAEGPVGFWNPIRTLPPEMRLGRLERDGRPCLDALVLRLLEHWQDEIEGEGDD
jgi:hypothetical protein